MRSKIQVINDEIKRLETEKEKIIKESEKILNKIILEEVDFGLPDPNDSNPTAYFPCELVSIIDRKNYIVKIYEPSIDAYHIVDVTSLHIDEYIK